MDSDEDVIEIGGIEELLDDPRAGDYLTRRHKRFQGKNRAVIKKFIGDRKRVRESVVLPRYYISLLAWALFQYISRNKWDVVRTLGYASAEPVFQDIDTSCDDSENLVVNGQLLLKKGDCSLIVTVDMNPRWRAALQVEGIASQKDIIKNFSDGVGKIVGKENFYIGKKVEFSGSLRFLKAMERTWDSIILDESIKNEIRANSIEFLENREFWAKHGIPLKRGILIAGDPGTGKSIVCKALLTTADGLTCIVADPDAFDNDGYISELYEVAAKLKPTVVVIEDIDLISQSRMEFGYMRAPALMSLLAMLDGVEECNEIVTVATTNNLETLDKAIRQRPARFDRVIKLSCPNLDQRKEQISRLCRTIPLDEESQDYIARKTDRCAPAQVEGILRNIFVEKGQEWANSGTSYLALSQNEIEVAIGKVTGENQRDIGFPMNRGNGHSQRQIGAWNQKQRQKVEKEDGEVEKA